MQTDERREHIIAWLQEANEPIRGSDLAQRCKVSRQVIVQDIALLRAQGIKVISTSVGYMVYQLDDTKEKRVMAFKHDLGAIEEELGTIVRLGGEILDVIVTHPVYGEISGNLMIRSMRQLELFMKKLEDKGFVPLLELTDGIHYHTIQASDAEILDEIEAALKEKGYLFET